MSIAHQLRDLREDVRSLLEYAQNLGTETENLSCALRGSVVFLRRNEQKKVLRALATFDAPFPRLKTVSSTVTHGGAARHAHGPRRGGSPEHLEQFPVAGLLLTGERGECEGGGEGGGERESGEDLPLPVLYTTGDLGDMLLEHNKLLGRLHQFTSGNTSTPTTSSPNIGEHHVIEVGVVGFSEHQNTSEFVIHISWSNGQNFEIYRKYLDFFTLQARLKEIGTQKTRNIPELPLSDHLMVVLGQLNSSESLYHRTKLVDTYCKGLVEGARERERSDISRTSLLIFFVPRPGDVQIESTRLDGSYRFGIEGEDVESEDCLGFLSSVALAEEEKWHNTHSDDPKTDQQGKSTSSRSRAAANLKFTKPSPAHPILVDTHSAPATQAPPLSPNLSILKGSSSLDHEHTTHWEWGEVGARGDMRRRSNIANDHEISLARAKAISIKTGNMDWGVRQTATNAVQQIDKQ